MSKKRLPPKVHPKDGRYYYVDQNKWHALSRIDEGMAELHRRLATRTDQLPNTLAKIFTDYIDGPLKDLAPSTQKTYEYFLTGILMHRFGHLLPSEIDEGVIAQYMERRKDDGAAVSGNRERAALSSAFEFAMRKGLARRNPCRGVRRNKEKPSKKHLESVALAADFDRAPPHFARVLQWAYLTGMREEDIIKLEVAAVTPAGIEWTESKTKKDAVILWTPTLRGLVREILEARAALDPQPEHSRLLTNRFGEPLTMWGITSNVRRLNVEWTFRDLRPKAQTDAGDRNVIGHVGQMRERYTRRSRRVPVR